MATHSSIPAWRIPWTEEPGGLPSMGLYRVSQTQLKRLSSSSSSNNVYWAVRRSNQSILEEINPEHSLEGLMLKLKLQYFGQLM